MVSASTVVGESSKKYITATAARDSSRRFGRSFRICGWAFTSLLGAQDLPGRLDQIGQEWKLNTRELLKKGDPAVFAILTNPEYNLPTVAPDGKYDGITLEIEPFAHE